MAKRAPLLLDQKSKSPKSSVVRVDHYLAQGRDLKRGGFGVYGLGFGVNYDHADNKDLKRGGFRVWVLGVDLGLGFAWVLGFRYMLHTCRCRGSRV